MIRLISTRFEVPMARLMEMPDNGFCQSCAMPFYRPEDHGTEPDGTRNGDYCNYCYEDGVFLQDYANSDELVAACAPMMAESCHISVEQAEHIDGYFDYTVPPLEGLWSMEKGVPGVDYTRKADFHWTSMIRLPEFVTDKVFAWAKASFAAKHPEVDINRAYLFDFDEGVVAQVMHKGPYDDEPATVTILDGYARSQGYGLDFSDTRRHHEIYLSDPRRAKPENLKTIIRHPVVKVG